MLSDLVSRSGPGSTGIRCWQLCRVGYTTCRVASHSRFVFGNSIDLRLETTSWKGAHATLSAYVL